MTQQGLVASVALPGRCSLVPLTLIYLVAVANLSEPASRLQPEIQLEGGLPPEISSARALFKF